MLDFQQIENAHINQDPYPYIVVYNSIQQPVLDSVINDFPDITSAGSIPVDKANLAANFKSLIAELEGDRLRHIIQQKFNLDLTSKPIMITLRGLMRRKDGRIHTDSKSKIITVLLYLNKEWYSTDAHLRILNNGSNIDDYAEQIPPAAGTMVIFQVTDNCWHGHTPMEGKRLSIQMNYLVSQLSKNKHSLLHQLSKKVKDFFIATK